MYLLTYLLTYSPINGLILYEQPTLLLNLLQ